jgi:phage tail-like protein
MNAAASAARAAPIGVFNFHVAFSRDPVETASAGSAGNSATGGGGEVALCQGAFSELSGLEATMEPRNVREGGRNWGSHQRPGQVNFATVVLKRGITPARDLWWWFELLGQGGYSARLKAEIELRNVAGERVMGWTLRRAMPVKFKAADLNARATEVGIEELHIVHEGLEHLA